jgi:predicted  nucleic acid-binding Zn-ribbon protein
MAGKGIHTTIGFDGKDAYLSACKQINAELKTLSSEMKLVGATFADSANSTDALTAKQTVLKKQFDEQAKKVSEAEKALQALTLSGKGSAEALAYMENELVKAKTAMVLTGNEISKTDTAMKTAGSTMDGSGKSIEKVDQTLKVLDSELKLVNSSYKDKSVEGYAAKQQVLQKVLAAQTEKVKLTEKALNDLKASGNGTTEQISALEIELNESKSALAGTKEKLDETGKSMEGAGDKADEASKDIDKTEKSSNKAGEAFKVLGKAALEMGKFAVEAGKAVVSAGLEMARSLVDFGISTIAVAADVEAAGSAFDQVFGANASSVQEKLDKLGGELGIFPDRLKEPFTQTYAFFTGIGGTAEEAMDITTRSTAIASDAAAFMNMSFEEAKAVMDSVAKGNYGVSDSIGVVFTETIRETAATEMYGKKFKDLTAIQKENVFLKVAEDTQVASGVMGQAAREAESWANVTENLKSSWSGFQSIIGSEKIAAIVPITQDIT